MFRYAKVFNQDVSNWNTGAVIIMNESKCNLSPSLVLARLCVVCFKMATRVSNCQFSHFPFLFSRSFFVNCVIAPSLAVFSNAFAFNQDVSNWNTGAVTTMEFSK